MINHLQNIFQLPLPGETSQLKMSPSERNTSGMVWNRNEARNCSVLILLYFKDGSWYFPLIKRQQYNGAHSGQISLPGGKWEKHDATPWDAAVRETIEETGVDLKINFIGELTPLYIPFSNFNVYPFVGYIDASPNFQPDNVEVDKLIETSLVELLAQHNNNNRSITFEHHNQTIIAPCYNIEDNIVWGATAMMLSEFFDLAQCVGDQIIESSPFYSADNAPKSPSHIGKVLDHDNSHI